MKKKNRYLGHHYSITYDRYDSNSVCLPENKRFFR